MPQVKRNMAQDTIETQCKFISSKHKAYSENVVFEILHSQEDKYRLQNVIKMQVSNLQLALQIYRLSQVESELEIFSLEKTDSTILKEIQERTKKSSIQNSFCIQSLKDTKEILDLNAVIVELVSLLNDKDKEEEDIEALLNQVKEKIDFYKEKNMIFDDINDYGFSHTKEVFTKARETLNKICNSLDKFTQESQRDFENRFNKDIIHLSAQIISSTHLPMLTHILIQKLGANAAKKILLRIGGVALGPFGIVVSIVDILIDIYIFFSYEYQQNDKLKESYKLYGAIMSIYEHLNYSLASLLNFKHIGAGNLITTQRDKFYTYYLYPDCIKFHSAFLYPFLKDKALNFEDISYKVTLSLNAKKEPNQAYIENIFEKDNKNDKVYFIDAKKRTQFSTFSFEHLYKIYKENDDNNFTHSSAFQHLQNAFLKFDSFLFIKSSSFSSVLASDMLLQSFTRSKQQDKARINKTALFLINCLHNGLPEYQVQNHIKNELYSNENTRLNVLFLSAMYRIKKASFVRALIDELTKSFNELECCIDNITTQEESHYVTQNLGKIIQKYNVRKVRYYGRNHIGAYTIDDKKICDMSERDFCNFIYDLCQVFVSKKHMQICDDFMDDNDNMLIDYWYKNDQEKVQVRTDIQRICKNIVEIILDVSYLFSHFNSYEIVRFKEYQEQIEKEYKKQRQMLEKFFSKEFFESNADKQEVPNIFYNIKEIKELCLAVLEKYFNVKNSDEKKLESLLKKGKDKIKISKAEEILKTNNKLAYYQITIEYVITLLPLNDSFLNCIEEEYAFLFSRLIIEELKVSKNKNAFIDIDNFIANYEITIGLYTLIYSNDKDFDELLNTNGVQKTIEAFYEISAKAGKKILENELKIKLKKIGDKYGVITALIFEDSTKDKIKTVASNIAKELDKRYTQHLSSVVSSKKFSLLSSFANSAISYVSQATLDTIFPVQIASVTQMKQQTLALLFALNRHRNIPYATCKQGSEYLTFPIEITQTLVNADLKAVIVGGSALDSGLFVHTPSVAFFNEDSKNALITLKATLKHFMNNKVNFIGIGEKGKNIVKEAYAKLWYCLGMGKNVEIESYLRKELQIKLSDYTLENLTSDEYIKTKLKKAKDLDNNDENFIEVEDNAKGDIKFNHDFLIQLKRVAEYNYTVYMGSISTEDRALIKQKEQNEKFVKVDKSSDEYLCGNLIYDEDYIPTTIDIVD